MSKFIRTAILNFSELPLEAQSKLIADSCLEESDLHETSFVRSPIDENDYLPLSQFLRAESKLWSGYYGLSAFSAFFIKIDRSGQIATVGYRHW